MRIIAGQAGGVPLKTPHETNDITRPTMDRVRSALFSILGTRCIGAHVLDLFAGSGSLGIEALSRGAASAHFVDHHQQAISIIQENLQKSRLIEQFTAKLIQTNVFAALPQLRHAQEEKKIPLFDLIFADPPYAKNLTKTKNASSSTTPLAPSDTSFLQKLLQTETLPTLIAPEGLLILEASKKEEVIPPPSWEKIIERTYGNSQIVILRIST